MILNLWHWHKIKHYNNFKMRISHIIYVWILIKAPINFSFNEKPIVLNFNVVYFMSVCTQLDNNSIFMGEWRRKKNNKKNCLTILSSARQLDNFNTI